MIYKYNSRYPFLNTLDEALRYHYEHPEDFSEPIKVKTIGLVADEEIASRISHYPKLWGSYKNKDYLTTDIPLFFGKWSYDDFDFHYAAQIKLMNETMTLLKTTNNAYNESSERETMAQYTDLFFAY